MTHPEEEVYNESEVMSVTREASGRDTESVQEAADEGETGVDEVVGKYIKKRKSYNISVQIGVLIYMKK